MDLRRIDLNLLGDLDALLTEGSVAGAARRLHLSAPAMSRRLGHLREAFGDPLLVQAGRRLAPTARALALKPRVAAALQELRALIAPPEVDPASMRRTLTVRANDGFYPLWAGDLVARISLKAPGLKLHFILRADKDVEALRSGEADLDLGVPGRAGPEIKMQWLFDARFVGVVRQGHPLQRGERVDAADFARWPHVSASRRGHSAGPIDDELKKLGLEREVTAIAPGFSAAMAIAARSNLVAAIPEPFARWAAETSAVHVFDLPVVTPKATVSMSWHPRQDADAAHRLLRAEVKEMLAFSR